MTTTSSVGTAIIGGGIVGVTLAYYLAKQSESDIVVLERNELASGATGGSLGGVRQQFSTPTEIDLALRGRKFWQTFEDVFDYACPYYQDGYLMLTGREELFDRLSGAAKLQIARGAPQVEMLRPKEISELVPWLQTNKFVGACWTSDDGRINPTDGVYGVAGAARKLGVKIREHHEVTGVKKQDGGWLLEGAEPILAERVVVAGGLGSAQLLQSFNLELEIFPWWIHYGFTTPVLTGERLPLTIDLDTGWCVEREQDGAVVTILSNFTPSAYSSDDMLVEFAELAEERAPAFTEVGIRATITAAADATGGDGHPFVGEVEDGLWVITGFDGHGTMMGPVASELLAAQIAGIPDPTFDLSVFDPHRKMGETQEWLRAARKA